jgi:hypothetical protein
LCHLTPFLDALLVVASRRTRGKTRARPGFRAAPEREQPGVKPLARAALDGVIATVPQTVVQAALVVGRDARWVPPQEIAAALIERAGLGAARPGGPAFHAAWVAAHVGYGAALGVAHRFVGTRVPVGPVSAGVTFGAAVWALHYAAALPALGLYPSPRADPPSRRWANMAGHGVFGLAIGLLARHRR